MDSKSVVDVGDGAVDDENAVREEKRRKRKEKNRKKKKNRWVQCPQCGLRIQGYVDAADHIDVCRLEQLDRARGDPRVVVVSDVRPHLFDLVAETRDSDGGERNEDGVKSPGPAEVDERGGPRNEDVFRCLDCRRLFPTYRLFCLHAGSTFRKPNSARRFLSRL